MGERLTSPPSGFDELPIEEQVAYVRMLSNHIAATHDLVILPNRQLQLIVRSRADRETDPGAAMPWEEVPAALARLAAGGALAGDRRPAAERQHGA